MTEEQKELLTKANQPEEIWDGCYISDEGQIFTPLLDANNNMLKTGVEVYNDWKAQSTNAS